MKLISIKEKQNESVDGFFKTMLLERDRIECAITLAILKDGRLLLVSSSMTGPEKEYLRGFLDYHCHEQWGRG